VPTHIIWGEDDRVIPPAYAAALKGLIAGATVTMLPSSAHLPHIEQPQAFASDVAQFIRSTAR
jgi:pimeloyl-ACP methyl ester carboxylesterase